MTPPPVPSNSVYTSCYCEENIYLLADALCRPGHNDAWEPYVVFISNHQKTAALWQQKAREGVVVWDYHVVLVLRPRALGSRAPSGGETAGARPDAWVYDLDSRCPVPCRANEYVRRTFPYAAEDGWSIPASFVSCFRVVPVQVYLDHFVSDRSHMLVAGQRDVYLAAPPAYPPLRGRKMAHSSVHTNLMAAFVAMGGTSESEPRASAGELQAPAADVEEARTYGEVLGMSDFLRWVAGSG